MTGPTEPSSPIEIASLRPKQAHSLNLLAPGGGTPWEDRGSTGAIAAFFRTSFQSMFSIRKLLASIRRPETVGDARVFAIICCTFWGIGWFAGDIIRFAGRPGGRNAPEFDLMIDGRNWLVHLALGIGGAWVLLTLISRFFQKLITSGGTGANVPPTVSYNVIAYCLGPSLLALIPKLIGPAVALAWITLLIIIGSATRLGAKLGNAAVCTLMSVGLFIGLSVGGYFLVAWVLSWAT